MKKLCAILALALFPSCKDATVQPAPPHPVILTYVHWEETPSAGIKVELVQTGESKLTDSTGHALFSVTPGKYVLRVYGINRGGPATRTFDFPVEVTSADTAHIDVVDCL